MQLKKLSVYGILADDNFTFDFGSSKKTYKKKEADRLSEALSYAFYGDPSLSHGKVELTFEMEEEFSLVRDFEANKAVLKSGEATLTAEAEINTFFEDILGLNKEKWSAFFAAQEQELYEKSFENTSEYFTSVLKQLNIDAETIDAASARFRAMVQDYAHKEELIEEIKQGYQKEETEKRIETLTDEIGKLLEKIAETKKAIALMEESETIQKDLAKVQEEYKIQLDKEEEIAAAREHVKKSDKVKHHVAILKQSTELIKENDELDEYLKKGKESLAEKIKEVATGERVLKKKEKSYVRLSTNIQAMYTALKELICDNVAEGKSDQFIIDNVNKFFVPVEKQIKSLFRQEKELTKELEKTENEIARYSQKYKDKYAAMSFEKLYQFNRDQLERASERLNVLTGNGVGKPSDFISAYHDMEKEKDELSRLYYRSDGILQDIEGIEGKISENNAAVKEQQESLNALENAKETLSQYLEKCKGKVDAADAEIFTLRTRLQYYNEIDTLEYGNRCPVCNMPVIDKADNSAAEAEINDKIKKCNDDIAEYRGVLKEYAEKLEQINFRIGSLQAKINTGKGYIDSLQQSKLAKIRLLGKLYEEAGVKNREELTVLLEKTVREVAQASLLVGEMQGLTTSTFITGENVTKIATLIREASGEDNGEAFSQCRKGLIALEKEEKLSAGALGVTGAADGDVYKKLRAALRHKKDVEKSLEDVRAEIIAYCSRSKTVKNGEKEMNYGQLCILYAGKQYSSIVEEIKAKEKEQQDLKMEIAALNKVLEDKRDAIEKEGASVRDAEMRFKNNVDFLDALQADEEGCDKSLLKGSTIVELENQLLSPGERDGLVHKIEEYDKGVFALASQCKLLESLVVETLDPEQTAEKKNQLPEDERLLAEKREELIRLQGEKTMAQLLSDRKEKLREEGELYKANYSYLNRVLDDGAVILRDTVNYALMNILPGYTVECKGSGLVLKNDKKVLTTINDELYSVLIVALTDAFRYVVSGIIDCPTLFRSVKIKAASVGDNVKQKINEYAQQHNLLVVYTK